MPPLGSRGKFLTRAEGAELTIKRRPVESLRPAHRNPRTHSPDQIRQIAESIRRFGFTNPVLVDDSGALLAGHGRLAAARLLGLTDVPTICLSHLSAAERRAYVLADNRLAELAGWDRELLAVELAELFELDLGFDLEVIGFATADLDLLIDGLQSEADPAADEVPEVRSDVPPVSQPGDLWRLGPHRLLCGDARDAAVISRLMAGALAQMVFTDPPYNVRIDGHASGLGRQRHREFAMASGEMSEAEFTGFLKQTLGNLAAKSDDGAIHFICMDWRHLFSLLSAGRAIYPELKNLCVWNKTNGGMGSLYRSKHELIAVFKKGKAPHINNVALGQHGRYRTNVWDYAGVNTLKEGRDEELAMHPTVKPAAMVADAIRDCSRRGGRVLDGFAGSGTTLIAAQQTGRQAYALEIDPVYVDVAVRRWQTYSGETAMHEETGLSFEQLAERRSANTPTLPARVRRKPQRRPPHG
jgi:DNA modification methylase